jgi:hypothetical protein
MTDSNNKTLTAATIQAYLYSEIKEAGDLYDGLRSLFLEGYNRGKAGEDLNHEFAKFGMMQHHKPSKYYHGDFNQIISDICNAVRTDGPSQVRIKQLEEENSKLKILLEEYRSIVGNKR